MQQEIAFAGIDIHAKYNALSERRSGEARGVRGDETPPKKINKEVARLLLGIAACMLVSLGVGVTVLLLNLPR